MSRSSLKNGLIELSYARSAGTAGAPLPAEITSRRDRGKQERQKQLRQQREEEEARIKKGQEEAARFLKQKWKEEKRRRKGDGTDFERGDGDFDEEPPFRRRFREDPADAKESPGAEVSGSWQEVAVEPAVSSRGSVSDEKEEARRAALASAFGGADEDDETRRQRELAAESRKAREEERAKRSQLASTFGFGDDDDDDRTRREMELAAKRSRPGLVKESLPLPSSSSSSLALAAAGGSADNDMYTVLKKMADFKRSCNGARKPMPEALKAELAALAERTGRRFDT
mmetsp:Transcript_13091/g.30580  ORF Transcript_13091/g.30580 Transcript_13091/m.30580 type:complete len:286 (+) Transcript_13091:90-947(+)